MKLLIRKLNKNQAGLTLIELMIALAITGIVTAAVTVLTFQIFDGEARANNHMDAINRVQNAGRQVSRDASMAQSVVWVGESDPDGFPITLAWNKWGTGPADSESHEVIYSIEGNQLKREHYINDTLEDTLIFQYIIGTDPDEPGVPVTYCERDPSTNQLTFTLTAMAGSGSQQVSETRQYTAIPRPIML